MIVTISRGLLEDLLARAAASPDREICGLLFGTPGSIDRAVEATNVAEDPARSFEIDPAALIRAHRATREGGPALIGHYHSHPNGRAEPSARDAEMADMRDPQYWLILTSAGARLWRSGRPDGLHGVFAPVDLVA